MVEFKYRGRVFTTEDILHIRTLIAAHPGVSRRRLSQKLCEAWQWKQPNGALRDMVCRGLLLLLDRAGQIELPAVKFVPANPLVRRACPAPVQIDTSPLEGRIDQMEPLQFAQVRRTPEEQLFNSLSIMRAPAGPRWAWAVITTTSFPYPMADSELRLAMSRARAFRRHC